LTLVHSSDLHLGAKDPGHSRDPLANLHGVIMAARRVSADFVLLAGDVFDHRRVSRHLLERVASAMAGAGSDVVILPGNHDCLGAGSVYEDGRLPIPPNVAILGVTTDDRLHYPDHDLEIWGRPHRDHGDMAPLHEPPPRAAGRRVAMGHGHWVRSPNDERYSWLIRNDDIRATAADYVALGHWDTPSAAGDGFSPAYYSGSPHLARTVNVVRFANDGVSVARHRAGTD
jgi:DNA repair exonuclease SbcCD nuclease subunit